MTIPYTFAGATTAIPLAQLDANFASPITLGNVAMTLSNTYTSIGNLTLTNVTVSSGNVAVTNANVTTLTATNDASISGLTVGKGGGALGNNTATGNNALLTNSSGNQNSAFGQGALQKNTTGGDNTGIGFSALFANTTGGQNTALGREALQANTTASNNTAVGYQAGYSGNTASNVFIGYHAGYATTTGGNTILGAFAGETPTGGNNTLVGFGAGNALTTGNQNTFIGSGVLGNVYGAGSAITTGSKNTILGAYSGNQGGLDIRTNSNYIVLSDGDGNPNLFIDNNKVIRTITTSGFSATAGTLATAGNNAKAGISGAFSGNVFNISWTGSPQLWIDTTNVGTLATVSDYRIKRNIQTQTAPALERVIALRPVTYQMADYGDLFKSSDDIKEGFIAHELQEIIPSGVDGAKDDETQIQSLRVDAILSVAVKAIQELNAKVDAQALEITALKGN